MIFIVITLDIKCTKVASNVENEKRTLKIKFSQNSYIAGGLLSGYR